MLAGVPDPNCSRSTPGQQLCVSCGTLVSRFQHDRDVTRVSSDDSDLYGRDYWFGHMENDFGYPNIYQRARTDLTQQCPYWLEPCSGPRPLPASSNWGAHMVGSGDAQMGRIRCIRARAQSCDCADWANTVRRAEAGKDSRDPRSAEIHVRLARCDRRFMDVLEHLPDPVATMRHCIDLLTPDGFLLIRTPKFPEGRSRPTISPARVTDSSSNSPSRRMST